jgi:predicted RNA binding protein YcfA (HicA-like mRNA interferase family)
MAPPIHGVSHQQAVRAFQKLGYHIAREGKHTILRNRHGTRLTIPRHNPINAITMGAIVQDAGVTVDAFKAVL